MSPRFLSQNMVQKESEKKMPSKVANAIICSAKLALVGLHHLRAQLALHWTHGTVSMAWIRCSFSSESLMYVLMRREYVSLWPSWICVGRMVLFRWRGVGAVSLLDP